MKERVLVFDFGSQYTQLIARRVREANVFSEIVPFNSTAEAITERNVKGIILSGGPANVYATAAPQLDPSVLETGIPVLGICYGMQAGCQALGAQVGAAHSREYGRTQLTVHNNETLFLDVPGTTTAWMSHGDIVEDLPDAFERLASTPNCPAAAAAHRTQPFYALQFHPEVTHSEHGQTILNNFLRHVCGCTGDWDAGHVIDAAVGKIRDQVGDGRVICGLSGGVDSTVAATLIHKAVGNRQECIFVDNGLLRKGEAQQVLADYAGLGLKVHFADASDRFLDALDGVEDPEKKRKIIGRLFIDVFSEKAEEIENVSFLAQGTLYPDVIESVAAFGGPTAVIKSHHNVGGLPEKLGFDLVEPLRDLFKDEVRRIGLALGIAENLIWRQPFPGPGLAVRIVGPVTREALELLREADAIVMEEFIAAGWYRKAWQFFAVLLPVKSVGVMGDERTYENAVALRVVESADGMTADWAHVPYDLLGKISNRIINEVRGINRVVYDISSKPPSTIEWE